MKSRPRITWDPETRLFTLRDRAGKVLDRWDDTDVAGLDFDLWTTQQERDQTEHVASSSMAPGETEHTAFTGGVSDEKYR